MYGRGEDSERKERVKQAQRRAAGGQLLMLNGLLCGYRPTEAFWEFLVPGRPDIAGMYSFRTGYEDVDMTDLPETFGKPIDEILTRWLEGQCTNQEAVADLRVIVDSLADFRSRLGADTLLASHVDSIRNSIGEFCIAMSEHTRPQVLEYARAIRQVVFPGMSTRDDLPPGRG